MSILLQSLPLRAPDCWYCGPVVTLERRGKSEASHTRGSVNEEATSNRLATSLPELSYIEEAIARGAITIGVIPPLKECVAIAHEGKNTLAMLKR